MSFVSNARTRKTKRACTHHTTFKSVLSSTGATPIDDTRFNRGPKSAVRNQTAETTTIGSYNSRGLTIVGDAMSDSFQYAPNPYDYPVHPNGPLGEQVHDDFHIPHHPLQPNYPITYSGPGHLAFQSGFSVPYIEGSTEIKGDLVVHGAIRALGVVGVPAGTTFTPVIKDALGNELSGVTTQASYKSTDYVDYFETCITWTGKTNLVNGNAIQITGFPLTSYSNISFATVVPDYGIYTINTGAQLVARGVVGASYIELLESDTTSADPISNVYPEQFDAAGKVCISGWLHKL